MIKFYWAPRMRCDRLLRQPMPPGLQSPWRQLPKVADRIMVSQNEPRPLRVGKMLRGLPAGAGAFIIAMLALASETA